MNKKHIFIIGCKGIPSKYGGFETFVEKLTEYREDKNIQYHVACMDRQNGEHLHNHARCFEVRVPQIGPAKAVYYDLAAMKQALCYIRKHKLEDTVIYILACRIGPFMWYLKRKCRALCCKVYVNPDGHEWMRAKWNAAIKKYWKYSEKLMVKHADLLICDSVNIEKYIKEQYAKYRPSTTFLSYGADVKEEADDVPCKRKETAVSDKCNQWYDKFGLTAGEYYLIVGRFVPENNYAAVIKEFLKADTEKQLVLITNYEKNKYYEQLKEETNFEIDGRIRFVGTVYDAELLYEIRKNAFAYIHGHEVGGTNPSLLEALAATDVNLLLDVSFNREVGAKAALYWTKEAGNLSALIARVEKIGEERRLLGKQAKERIRKEYSWEKSVRKYEILFRT